MFLFSLLVVILNLSVAVHSQRRIVNGTQIPIEEVPFQVGLYVKERFDCGGSLISEDFVLTAAHCVENVIKKRLKVRVGTDRKYDEDAMKIGVEKIILHPKYDRKTVNYDFALLELKSHRKFPSVVEFAKLPEQDSELDDGVVLTVTGWGDTSYLGKKSKVLLAVDTPTVNREKCAEAYSRISNPHKITDAMFCAGYEDGRRGSCQSK